MKSTPINSVTPEPEGLYISTKVKDLPPGEYAFMENKKNGFTDILQFTKSHGTDFYKYFCTIADVTYGFIAASKLFQPYTVELNACPRTSDTMEYAEAFIFNI